MDIPRLAVIIPAFNEEARLGATLQRIHQYLADQTYQAQIHVISDGSRDGTCDLVRKLADEIPTLRLTAYPNNCGKGCAVRTGMLTVQAEWLLLSDADLATPIEEVEKLFAGAEAQQAPIAIGSRPLRDSKLEIRQPWYREALGRTFNGLVQTLAIRGIRDTQCGFKLFRADVAREVFGRCKLDGFGYDFESLLIARDLGHPIAEIPIRWMHQEGSKVVVLRDGPRMVADLIRLRIAGKRRRLLANANPIPKDLVPPNL